MRKPSQSCKLSLCGIVKSVKTLKENKLSKLRISFMIHDSSLFKCRGPFDRRLQSRCTAEYRTSSAEKEICVLQSDEARLVAENLINTRKIVEGTRGPFYTKARFSFLTADTLRKQNKETTT